MSQDPNNSSPPASGLAKQYVPSDHEPRINAMWDSTRAFHADPAKVLSGEKKPYAIFIPPPNVTAALHLGHALNNTLQDVLARAHRMMGFETLWMPGTDHAGIATQAVVEKRVQKEEGKRRKDFSREAFIAKIQAFKDEYEATITNQLKAMGCSCDWSRQRFTMDPVCAKAVREAFFRLFRDGLIYRGKRLVNWDPALQTAVADDECYDEDIDGAFYYLKYPLVKPVKLPSGETIDHITVATTRPETYLGDTAVALNPRDPRAKALVGQRAKLPLINREIPIIADDYAVLREQDATSEEEKNDPKAKFSTGFVKITPAHDPNDYDVWQRNKAHFAHEPINMMSPDGRISDKHGLTDIHEAAPFLGKTMAEGRKLVVKAFEELGLLQETKPHRHSVKHSDRSKAIIEPYLSDQWYVRVTDPRLAASANNALVPEQRTTAGSKPLPEGGVGEGSRSHGTSSSDGKLTFHPARYAKTYEQWHDNIRDWCISRQLWWGHRIPVWHTRTSVPNAPGYHGDGWWFSELDSILDTDRRDRCSIRIVHVRSGREIDPFNVRLSQEMDPGSPEHLFDIYVCTLHDDDAADLIKGDHFTQDPDVLDTWFSSALWPISTLGWPDPASAGKEFPGLLDAFNPSSVLCTAREIITLWVSRMVMFNRYFLDGQTADGRRQTENANASTSADSRLPSALSHGRLPFKDVFIHAMIQDGQGRKMSKSLGNGVDPLDIIATHGTDAMRFTLVQMTTQTQDVRMPVVKDSKTGKNTSPKFDEGKKFANKLWNAASFTIQMLTLHQSADAHAPSVDVKKLSLVDRWMLSRLERATREVNESLKNYEFSTYATTMYNLVWNDFCSWYLESIKPTIAKDANQRAVLLHAMNAIIRLLHPIMPFVTEAIAQELGKLTSAKLAEAGVGSAKTHPLALAHWPTPATSLHDDAAEKAFAELGELVEAIRQVRASANVPPKRRITLHAPAALVERCALAGSAVQALAELDRITTDSPTGASTGVRVGAIECRLSNLADAGAVPDASGERDRVSKELADTEKTIGVLQGRLSNPGYAERAPAAMVQQTKDQLTAAQAKLAALKAALEKLP